MYDTYWRLIYTHNEGSMAFEADKEKSEADAL